MQLYNALAILTVLAALFGYVNYRFIRLPDTIGVMLISLVASLGVVVIGLLKPSVFQQATAFIRGIDFYTLLVKIMLGFMLFAGAINLDGRALNNERVSVLTFSTISVLLSTALVGGLLYLLCLLLHQPIPFVYCLLFGALIAPTHPLAVLSSLRRAGISPSLEIKIIQRRVLATMGLASSSSFASIKLPKPASVNCPQSMLFCSLCSKRVAASFSVLPLGMAGISC